MIFHYIKTQYIQSLNCVLTFFNAHSTEWMMPEEKSAWEELLDAVKKEAADEDKRGHYDLMKLALTFLADAEDTMLNVADEALSSHTAPLYLARALTRVNEAKAWMELALSAIDRESE